jgi:hypothetical protein
MGKNPLFNVVFDMVNIDMEFEKRKENHADLDITSYEVDHIGAVFDLILTASESNDIINLGLVYSASLFRQETAHKMTRQYIDILKQVVENYKIKLADVKISHGLEPVTSNIFQNSSEFGF